MDYSKTLTGLLCCESKDTTIENKCSNCKCFPCDSYKRAQSIISDSIKLSNMLKVFESEYLKKSKKQ